MGEYSRKTIDSGFTGSREREAACFFEGSKKERQPSIVMEIPQAGICRTATSWAMIGIGTAGVFGATTYALTDAMKIQASTQTAASPADLTVPLAADGYDMMATTSTAPSYAPKTHSQSRGS